MPQATTTSRFRRFAGPALLGLAMIAPSGAWSAEQGQQPLQPAQAPATQVRLLSEVAQAQAGQSFWIGVLLEMAPGWHTYWKNPGDAGMATRVRWQEVPGMTVGPIQWPAPERIETGGESVTLVSYGYEERVVLPMQVSPPPDAAPGSELTLDGRVDLVECKDVCVKRQYPVKLTVPIGPEAVADPEGSTFINDMARKALPVPLPDWQMEASAKGKTVVLKTTTPQGSSHIPQHVTVFPEDPNILDAAPPRVTVTPEGHRIELVRSAYAAKPPERLRAVLHSDEGWLSTGLPKAIVIDVPVK